MLSPSSVNSDYKEGPTDQQSLLLHWFSNKENLSAQAEQNLLIVGKGHNIDIIINLSLSNCSV